MFLNSDVINKFRFLSFQRSIKSKKNIGLKKHYPHFHINIILFKTIIIVYNIIQTQIDKPISLNFFLFVYQTYVDRTIH